MKYVHIGWCREGTSDKVWGVICLKKQEYSQEAMRWISAGKYLTFWGRRGAKLQTKLWEGTNWDANELFRKKQNKGYQSVSKSQLDEVYPGFDQDLEKTAVWEALRA